MDLAVFNFCYVHTAFTHICLVVSSSPACAGNEDRWFTVVFKVKIITPRVKIGQSLIGEFDHTFDSPATYCTVYAPWIYNGSDQHQASEKGAKVSQNGPIVVYS